MVEEPRVFHLPDIVAAAPEVDIGVPPADLPYEERDGWIRRELLIVNGIGTDPPSVLQALQRETGLLLACAATVAGDLGLRAAVPRLRELAAPGQLDDNTGVEAAYALALLAEPDGTPAVRRFLALPLESYLSPVRAAGCLARLGLNEGVPVLRAALISELVHARILACKQLTAVWLCTVGGDDARALFGIALADDNTTVRWEAMDQLRLLPGPEAQSLLASAAPAVAPEPPPVPERGD